ncbi:hypothetical protein [Actinocorallia longicatena]
MRRKTGVAAAGLALTMVVGVSVAAVAEGDEGGKKPGPGSSAPKDKQDKGKGDGWVAELAKRYGVSEAALERALRDVKVALSDKRRSPADPAIVAKLAGALGISPAEASKLIKEVFVRSGPHGGKGPGKPGGKKEQGPRIGPEVVAKALAEELGIAYDKAVALVADLDGLSRDHGNSPSDPRFAAIAKKLGLTAQRLEDALRKVKTRLSESEKPDPPKPVSPEPYKS